MDFAKEFMTKLDGKVSEEDMLIILRELEVFQTDYDISRKETGIVPYTGELPECYKAYMVSKKIEGLSKESLKTYDLYLSDFLYSVRKPVEEITTNDIRAYLYTYQQTHEVGNRTLDGRRIVIHTFLEWCRNERYISDNPADRISAIKYEVKPLRRVAERSVYGYQRQTAVAVLFLYQKRKESEDMKKWNLQTHLSTSTT